MNTLKDRAFTALNLRDYSNINKVDNCGKLDLKVPNDRQYVLRLLIKRPFNEYRVPLKFNWVLPLIKVADNHQKLNNIRQPFVYLTIRNGAVESKTDDEWHVDGFSQTITHLPEQNYIWSNKIPTEYVEKVFDFPKDFDGLRHNIHSFFNKNIDNEDILTMESKTVYGIDPYIVHRRPKIKGGIKRCFVRVSYTPIEIEDVNNTFNPLLPTNYKRDAVKEFRNKLKEY